MQLASQSRAVWLLLSTALLATAWSAWNPIDYATRAFELVPGGIATAVM